MPGVTIQTAEISASHSALTGVLAGFALAGIFLLIERVQEAKLDSIIHEQYLRAMLLLFVAFLTGTISSFLYSTIVGDSPLHSFFLFHFPSAVFAIHALVLLSGITVIFSAFGVGNILALARRISYLIVLFSTATIWSDLSIALEIFGLERNIKVVLGVIAFTPFSLSMIVVLARKSRLRRFIKEKTFSPFCYSAMIACLGVSFLHTAYRYLPEDAITFPAWIPILLMSGVSILGAWTVLLSPKDPIIKDDR